MSPLKLLGESFGEEIDDDNFDNISLTSFLGRLDSVFENNKKKSANGDHNNMSIASESMDYLARFEDLA